VHPLHFGLSIFGLFFWNRSESPVVDREGQTPIGVCQGERGGGLCGGGFEMWRQGARLARCRRLRPGVRGSVHSAEQPQVQAKTQAHAQAQRGEYRPTGPETRGKRGAALPTVFRRREKSIRELRGGLIGGRYEVGAIVGRGRFGVVRLGLDEERARRPVALKCMNRDSDLKVLQNELEILKFLMENNIEDPELGKVSTVPLDMIEQGDQMVVVTEYFSGGDLFDRILLKGAIDEKDLKPVVKRIVEALLRLHSHGLIHRDIKPENVLFRVKSEDTSEETWSAGSGQECSWDEIEPVLCDFGLSFIKGKADLIEPPAGTFGYASPQMLKMDTHVTSAVDVWSLGVTIFACLGGELPFPASTDGSTTLDAHLSEAYRGPKFHNQRWTSVSDEAKDLISQMLHYAPYNRISMNEIPFHPWFRSA